MGISNQDSALIQARMAITASKVTNQLLDKYGQITPKLPLTVPHMLAYGPSGTGKTSRIEKIADMMGCSEAEGTFTRISGETVKNIEDLVNTLRSKLSWQGYLCDSRHQVIDLVNPRSAIKPQLVFFDELHVLSKDLQEKLGLILLDFRYQLMTNRGIETVYFPKFTFAGATTRISQLIKPLQTRFGLKIAVHALSDQETTEVARNMLTDRGLKAEEEVIEIISKISQGIPRNCESHITGIFSAWTHFLSTGQNYDKNVITKEVAFKYIELQGYTKEGLNNDQVRVLKLLKQFYSDIKTQPVGIVRLCGSLGLEKDYYIEDIEPRLQQLSFIVSTGRGKEITKAGISYLNSL